ncbi:MAG: hypothetical protein KC613_21895, partial [Myxococcales bacterium]|nr:hypothetical protein [Myxococcales bacterium]
GADNDCDNQVDEDFPGRACCTQDFQCAPGQSCVDGECSGGGGGVPNPNPGGGGQPAAGCANPSVMAGFGQYPGNNGDNAGVDTGSCGGFLGGETVFTFTLGETRRVRLDTNGALVDTVIYVRTNCADAFSEVACDDDGGQGSAAQVAFEAQANVQYFVIVDSFLFGGGFTLNFGPDNGPAPECANDFDCPLGEVCVAGACVADGCLDDFDCPLGESCDLGECVPDQNPGCQVDADCAAGQVCQGGACRAAPAEPVCAAPIVMAAPGRYEASTADRPDQQTPSCQARASGGEVAFTFQLDAPQRVSLNTNGSSFDTVLSVRTDCAQAASEVVCDDDGGSGVQSATSFDAQAGVQYVVLVDGYSGANGAVVLDFAVGDEPVDPVDPVDPDPVGCDACGALQMCVVNQCFDEVAECPVSLPAQRITGQYGGDSSAGEDVTAPSCAPAGSPEHTLAYAVEAPRRVTASTAGSDYDTVLYVMSPCGEEIACNDDAGATLTSSVTFDAVPGVLYYIVVDGYEGDAGPYTLIVE